MGLPVLGGVSIWRQGRERRPSGGGGESLSPLRRGAVKPRTASSVVLGLVAAPLRSVGDRAGGDQSTCMASISPHPPHPSASATPSSSTLVDGPGSSSGRSDRSEKSERRQPAASPTHPRILIFSSTQKKLSSLSPFQRREGCDRFGKVVRCEKLRDGGIEVEFQSEKDAERALRATEFTYTAKTGNTRQQEQLPITVSAHRTKNSTRGIVFCPDLEGIDDEEIADGLSHFGVTQARRIMSRKDGGLVPTHNVVLTFDGLDLPREVTLGYVVVKVRQLWTPNGLCRRGVPKPTPSSS